ncbi:MAG: hypothetical protein HOP29_16460 [Phycisphaerales bacterium]|nr:hypothetical protein [Phycisphaerales bacterium]
MTQMDLMGMGPMGPVSVRLNPNMPTEGEIEETADQQTGRLDLPPFSEEGSADSFFDVFFVVEFGGQRYHNVIPKRMSSVITHKPPAPGNAYESPIEIPLLNENGQPTGFSIGAGRHVPRPVVEVDHFPNTTAVMELQLPDGGSVPIPLMGPTTVDVYFEGAAEGVAFDNDGDDRDEVRTRMTQMDLMGMGPMGPVSVRLNPNMPTEGEIEETADQQTGRLDLPPFSEEGSADSFFDVFFVVEFGGQRYHNVIPKRMSSVITHKPPAPGNAYESPIEIPLLNENGQPTGFSIGAGRHVPRPTCGPGAGDCFEQHPTPFCNREECCERVCELAPNCCITAWGSLCVGLAEEICGPDEACCLPNGQCKDVARGVCELGGGRPQGPKTSCENTECHRPGDCNGDGHVDLRDWGRFQICFTGAGGEVGNHCRCVDMDGDGDVDLVDLRIFHDVVNGP